MRAIKLFEVGDADQLTLVDVPVPVPRAGQILVRVEAAGVTFAETVERAGRGFPGLVLPAVYGSEIAGTVESLGPDTTGPAVGTRVVVPFILPNGMWTKGGYAEFALADPRYAAPLPDAVSSAESVTLLSQGLTAYLMLHKAIQVRKGETVLVHSAAGGVGGIIVQLARLLGAGPVIGTASTEAKRKYVSDLGADVVLDSRSVDWPAQVLEATGGTGASLIFEATGGEEGRRNLQCLAPYGRMVVYGFASGSLFQINPEEFLQLLFKNQSIVGFGSFDWLTDASIVRGILQALIDLAASGQLKLPTVEFPLEEAAAAHRALEDRSVVGKVVLVPSMPSSLGSHKECVARL
ncbi:zinc-binding dehydrogenase [Paraburkholderia sediminicola]|uniref:Zinc-binding dehydrogenase n=1 Tax=Paraburkholderia metrosideri TaxID=580937 RepID=A0ABW9DZS4_9BURK